MLDTIKKIQDINVQNKVVLLRVDLNLPMEKGKVTDYTRIERILPTINYLIQQGSKIVLLSHFRRPKGEVNIKMSLSPMVDVLIKYFPENKILFSIDCIGKIPKNEIDKMNYGDILLLENIRFYQEESDNDPEFVNKLASLGDVYINDAFSCSHRSHASILGLANALPSACGLLLYEEISNLYSLLNKKENPSLAIIGGSKISSKINVLMNLIQHVDTIVIGGAMANSFLLAQGKNIGKSLHEKELIAKAKEILDYSLVNNCKIILPSDVVVTKEIEYYSNNKTVNVDEIEEDDIICDFGLNSLIQIYKELESYKTVIWNGPIGIFEVPPYNFGTIFLAKRISELTTKGKIKSIGGGGDVVCALSYSGNKDYFSYISTAGGAFIEWLSGHKLPGITPLRK